MANGNGATLVSVQTLIGLAANLGVPVFVLAILLTSLMPRLDHGLMVIDRADAELQIIAARCGYPPIP